MIRIVTAVVAVAFWAGSAWAQPAAKPAAAKPAAAPAGKVKEDKKGPKESAGTADKASGNGKGTKKASTYMFWVRPR